MKADKQMTAALIHNDIIKSMGQQIEALMKSLNESEKQKNLLIQQLKFQYEEMDNDKKCSQQHLLRYVPTQTLKNDPDKLICTQCQKKADLSSTVCWRCVRCQQTYCVKCKRHRTSICPYAHPLVEVKQFKGYKFCDICKQKGIKSGWHCDCDFDICDQCHNPFA